MALGIAFKSADEERLFMKKWLAVFIGVMTLALAYINGYGAWVKTEAVGYTALAIGAEGALVVMFSLIVLSQTWLRRIVGFALFVGLAYFCVENGKVGVKDWMKDVFQSEDGQILEPSVLREEAAILLADATKLDTLPTDTKTESSEQRRIDREELAALRVEYQQMLAQDEQGIKAAQTALKARGDYRGPIDGIRADLTEAAMEKRGAEITARINILQAKLDEGSAQNAAVMALAPAADKRLLASEKLAQAERIEKAGNDVVRLLYTAEGVRSFGVWAFLMTGAATLTLSQLMFWRRKETPDAPPTQERETEAPGPQPEPPAPVDQDEAEAEAPEVEPKPVASADDLFDQPANDEPVETEAERQRRLNAQKGGFSNAFGREVRAMDDSIPVDPPGMEEAA
jgi:hypothetical protein